MLVGIISVTLHIIIDGYNLIRQSPEMSRLDRIDLQQGREVLLQRLAEYRKVKAHRITVVFDGTDAPIPGGQRDRFGGVDVRFSRRGEAADAVIQRMAAREKERALVVSSDRAVADFAAGRGAAVIDSSDFEARLELAAAGVSGDGQSPPEEGWAPTTRKKGPSHRLSKRHRRNRRKIGKL